MELLPLYELIVEYKDHKINRYYKEFERVNFWFNYWIENVKNLEHYESDYKPISVEVKEIMTGKQLKYYKFIYNKI